MLTRIDRLIDKGASLPLLPEGEEYSSGAQRVQPGPLEEWRTQALAFLNVDLGSDSAYTRQFVDVVTDTKIPSVLAGVGILRALREDHQDELDDSAPAEVL